MQHFPDKIKCLGLAIILWLFVATFQVAAMDVSGSQSGTWTLDNSPYIAKGDIVVPTGMTLTIEPGVVVKFSGYYRLQVNGTLLALGTLGQRIVFTSINDNEFGILTESSTILPTRRDWQGIEFSASSGSSSRLNYCIVRYCEKAITTGAAAPTLSHFIFADCNVSNILVSGRIVSIENGVEKDYTASATITPASTESNETIIPSPIPEQQSGLEQEIGKSVDMALGEEFSFGEILVVSASKREQTARQAPAVLTVITQEQIRERGYRTILEALRDVPGFDVNDPGNWVDTGMRGVNDRVTYGKHIQYLLDGHDLGFKQFTRNFVAPSWISMNDIDRIEIIRGPGSALWGANAFLGVVNIITKSATASKKFELVSQVGSYSTNSVAARASHRFGDQAEVSASIAFYHDNTSVGRKILEWSKVAEKDIFIENDKEDNYTFHLKTRFQTLKLVGHVERYDPNAPISTFSIGGSQSRFVTDRRYISLSWEPTTAKVNHLLGITFQNYQMAEGAQYEEKPFSPQQQKIESMAAKDDFIKLFAQSSYSFSDRLWIIGGVEYEYLKALRWHFPDVWEANQLEEPNFDVHSYAAFAEGQYTLMRNLYTTIGVRHDNHSIYGGVTNPKLALVWELPAGFYAKALYGEAFKAPSLHELYYFRKNAFYGNPELQPERVKTGELLLGYQLANRILVNLNVYSSDARDIISYKSRASSLPLIQANDFPQSQWPNASVKNYSQQENSQDYNLSGVELETSWTITQRISMFLNLAFNRARDSKTDKKLDYAAEKFANLGLTVKPGGWLTTTLLARYVGAKTVPAKNTPIETGHPYNPVVDNTLEAPAYLVADLVVFVPRLFSNNFFLTLKASNITNEEYYDAGREVLFAQMPRSYYVSLGASF